MAFPSGALVIGANFWLQDLKKFGLPGVELCISSAGSDFAALRFARWKTFAKPDEN
jgi:hypothetical protein